MCQNVTVCLGKGIFRHLGVSPKRNFSGVPPKARECYLGKRGILRHLGVSPKRNFSGVTLVEMMVSVAIFLVVMTGLYSTLTAGNMSLRKFNASVMSQREARKALHSLTLDLRGSNTLVVTSGNGTLSLSFNQPSRGGDITYAWANTGGSANQLIRQNGGTSRIIASNITTVSVANNPSDMVVNVTASTDSGLGKMVTVSLKELVAKR